MFIPHIPFGPPGQANASWNPPCCPPSTFFCPCCKTCTPLPFQNPLVRCWAPSVAAPAHQLLAFALAGPFQPVCSTSVPLYLFTPLHPSAQHLHICTSTSAPLLLHFLAGACLRWWQEQARQFLVGGHSFATIRGLPTKICRLLAKIQTPKTSLPSIVFTITCPLAKFCLRY